jgi:hypothetical protein
MKPIMDFIKFSEECQYFTPRYVPDETAYCHCENDECIEQNCPLLETAKDEVEIDYGH